MTSTYKPKNAPFIELYKTEIGPRIWTLLNTSKAIERMKTATKNYQPAVEGIGELLLEEFKTEELTDSIKQMIGQMTRQIMEGEGYTFDREHVKTTYGAPVFTGGASYKK